MPDDVCELRDKRCVPCEGGVPQLDPDQAERLRLQVPMWRLLEPTDASRLVEGAPFRRIERSYVFRNFAEALAFVNRVGAVAEAEGHHPDVLLHAWRKVDLALTTHAIKGLSENDFIVAAKIDALPGAG